MPLISLQKLSKTYQLGKVQVQALNNINLNINKGEFVAIMGPSGSGKSTLMNLVGCLDIPSSGILSLDQKDIAKLQESKLAQLRGKKIGFVFQTFNLIPSLTALENVILPMTFQNIPRNKKIKQAALLLEKVGLKQRINHKPNELSGGERQRVAIARALVNDPELILADEPTGNLDSKTGEEIINLLVNLNKEGKTLVIITHDPLIAKKAKRIIKLKDGTVVK